MEYFDHEQERLREVNQALKEENQKFREIKVALQQHILQREIHRNQLITASVPAILQQFMLGMLMQNRQVQAQPFLQPQQQSLSGLFRPSPLPDVNLLLQHPPQQHDQQAQVSTPHVELAQTLLHMLSQEQARSSATSIHQSTVMQHLTNALSAIMQSQPQNQIQALLALWFMLNGSVTSPSQATTAATHPFGPTSISDVQQQQQQQQLQPQRQLRLQPASQSSPAAEHLPTSFAQAPLPQQFGSQPSNIFLLLQQLQQQQKSSDQAQSSSQPPQPRSDLQQQPSTAGEQSSLSLLSQLASMAQQQQQREEEEEHRHNESRGERRRKKDE
jgi:hypothetical protein